VIRPELPALADDVMNALRDGVPAYAQPLDGAFGRGVRMGVEGALRQFVEMIGHPGTTSRLERTAYRDLGRGEMRAGRSLHSLLAAYRLGARAAWRRISAAGAEAGLAPETLYLVAEAMFAYIDELSASSVEGYALEQSAAAGESQRRRQRVVELLARGTSDPSTVEAAALEAGWKLPRRLAALAVDVEELEGVASALPTDAIAGPLEDGVIAFVADPDGPGRLAALERGLAGMRVGVGPTVSWAGAARSAGRALATLALVREGRIPGPFSLAREHMPALLVAADPELARELASERLAPLADLAPGARRRLEQTLRAWLDHQGRLQPIAAALHVHPQTVRYRVGQLRERFGDALDEPEARFELALALRAGTLADAPVP
jgi:hypothetical protein